MSFFPCVQAHFPDALSFLSHFCDTVKCTIALIMQGRSRHGQIVYALGTLFSQVYEKSVKGPTWILEYRQFYQVNTYVFVEEENVWEDKYMHIYIHTRTRTRTYTHTKLKIYWYSVLLSNLFVLNSPKGIIFHAVDRNDTWLLPNSLSQHFR